MENVFNLINVKLNDTDLVSLNSITNKNKIIDPDSDEFFKSLKERINLLSIYKDALQNIPLKPPMEHYYVSSPYGPRKHPVTGKYRMHHGIDLAGTWQENVSVSADGTVVFAGYHGSFGKVIRIKHNYGIMTTYGHLAKINVRRGDLVSEGQVIGKMGRTGKVKGAHLHYEISVNGKSQNPATYIKIGRNLLSRTSLKNFANKNLNNFFWHNKCITIYKRRLVMSLEKINKHTNSNKQLLNNLNDFIIQIDYFDQKGIKKRKNKIPLKYILNSKLINSQTAI